jgi:O-antigen ligase
VSLRGEYWQAAWNMGNKFPLNGVGMDSYGDWYRLLRDDQALINPGPTIVTNAAHNVVLDQFAYGGWPMLLAYLAILFLVTIAIIKVSIRDKEFKFTFQGDSERDTLINALEYVLHELKKKFLFPFFLCEKIKDDCCQSYFLFLYFTFFIFIFT